MRVDGALGQCVAGNNGITVVYLRSVTERNCICFLGAVILCDYSVSCLFDLFVAYLTGHLGDDRSVLRAAGLEKLLNSRKTLCDILGGRDTTGMERSHCKLCTRLTDGLRRDDTNSLADIDELTVSQRSAVAVSANAVLQSAGENRAYLYLLGAGSHDLCSVLIVHQLFSGNEYVAVSVLEVLGEVSAHETLCKRLNELIALADLVNVDAVCSSAVVLANDDLLRYVYQTSGQITRVGGSQRGIGKSLTGASGRNEVFQNVKAFTVVSPDWHFDGRTGRVGDKSTHSGELTDLVLRTTRSGVRHHVDVVVLIEVVVQRGTNIFGSLVPDADELCLSLGIGNKAAVELLVQLCNLSVSVCEDLSLLRRNIRVADSNGDTGSGGVLIAHCLDLIEYLSGSSGSVILQAAVDDLTELALADLEGYLIVELMLRIGSVNVAEILRNVFVEYDTSNGSGNELCDLGVAEILCNSYLDRSVNGDNAVLVSHESLVGVAEYLALALFAGLIKGQIVGTKYHILGRNGNRTSV